MPVTSPNAKLHDAIISRIEATVAAIRYIDQDMGQLENYEIRPAVTWPCVLFDIDESQFTGNGDAEQMVQTVVQLRLALVKYTESNNLVPTNIRANAHQYYEIEEQLYKAFHNYAPEGFGKFTRLAGATEKRDDDIRVRVLRFSISYTDVAAKPVRTVRMTPEPTIGIKD